MSKLFAGAAALIVAVSIAACGDSDDETTQPAKAGAGTLTIRMSEFAFDPKDATAKAGKVTIAAPNEGKVVHELVLLKTEDDPAKLPMDGDEVDESTSVGEVADVEPGQTKKVTLTLTAGKYAMVCALPNHYQSGMYGSLTVR